MIDLMSDSICDDNRVQLSSDGQRPGPGAKEKFVQVHVSFISKQIHMVVTEKVLREIFAPFGEIADVAIKKHTTIQVGRFLYLWVCYILTLSCRSNTVKVATALCISWKPIVPIVHFMP